MKRRIKYASSKYKNIVKKYDKKQIKKALKIKQNGFWGFSIIYVGLNRFQFNIDQYFL